MAEGIRRIYIQVQFINIFMIHNLSGSIEIGRDNLLKLGIESGLKFMGWHKY